MYACLYVHGDTNSAIHTLTALVHSAVDNPASSNPMALALIAIGRRKSPNNLRETESILALYVAI